MEGTMRVALTPRVKKIEYETRPIPAPKPHEVLVKISHVGVCGSDLHFYEMGHHGTAEAEWPMVLGHESAGVVVELGADVTGLAVGDKVALEPGYPCGKCEFCRSGRYNLCPDVYFMACPGIEGSFAEYMAWPAEMCFPLPANMDTVEGAMIEPLSVGMHTARLSEAGLGKSAAILGAGCIGLCTLLALRASGVAKIYVIDVIEKRLNKAKELGATQVINAAEGDAVAQVLAFTGGKGADIVVDSAGTLQTAQQTVPLLKRGGIISLVGMSNEPLIPLDLATVLEKEGRIQTIFRYCNLYPAGIDLVSSGLIPVKDVVTHTYNFNDLQQALDYNVDNKNDVVKIVINFD